jgi:hypothetical protein
MGAGKIRYSERQNEPDNEPTIRRFHGGRTTEPPVVGNGKGDQRGRVLRTIAAPKYCRDVECNRARRRKRARPKGFTP